MVDQRELVLQRILAVLNTVEGVAEGNNEKSVFRNRGQVPEDKRPAIVLLDGIERKRTVTVGGGRSRMPAVEMDLSPQIFVLLKTRSNLTNVNVGEELSEFRVRVLAALFADMELWDLLGGDSGQIEYRGADTDMQTGSNMTGEMQLDIAFTYIFDPDDLTA